MVFDSVSSNIDEVLSINSLETLMSIIRTGLPILVELIDLVNSNDLTQMDNFPTRISDCHSHSPALLDLLLLMLAFVLQ